MYQIVCVLGVVLLLSCSSKNKDLTSMLTFDGNQVDSIRRDNIAKQDTIHQLFGGYYLNMTNSQYEAQTKYLIDHKELHQFSPTEYSFWIKLPNQDVDIDAQPIPTFDNGRLIELKLLMWGQDQTVEHISLHQYFDQKYGSSFYSLRSFSRLWIRGSIEIELKDDLVETNPNISPMRHNILIYRSTQASLLGQL